MNAPSCHAPRDERNRRTAGICGAVVLLALLSLPARGGDSAPDSTKGGSKCPPGSTLVSVEESGKERRTYCKCVPGHVARGNQCVLKLPEIDPADLVSPEHAAFVRGELERLHARREKLEAELEKLGRLREQQDSYLQQMGEMREQLIYDTLGNLLSVVSAKGFLNRVPGISARDAEELARMTKLMKVGVEALAYARAGDDRERARAKALSAISSSLSLLREMTAPPEAKEALSGLIKMYSEVIKATDPNQKADNKPLRDEVAKTLDSLVAVAGVVAKPLGVARSGVHGAGGAFVLWEINNDKESIVEALVSSQRARLAAQQRLAATKELINIYEIELKKARQ